MGLKITKYERAGLQITIGFGLQNATKLFKIGYKVQWDITRCDKFKLQIATILQTATDYKVIHYNVNVNMIVSAKETIVRVLALVFEKYC